MRALLDKELAEALARRGLRGRPWAVEVDESAYTFLIEKGFSPELGARPLKRAVERHLLAPLAASIVEQSIPAGDQFLFITAPGGERIEVVFVDPDAEPEVDEQEGVARLDLPTLARAPRGDDGSVRFVLAELGRVDDAVESAQAQKGHALSAISEPGFWERDDRFELLAEVEYSIASSLRQGRRTDWAGACSEAFAPTGVRTRSSWDCSPDGCTSSTRRSQASRAALRTTSSSTSAHPTTHAAEMWSTPSSPPP